MDILDKSANNVGGESESLEVGYRDLATKHEVAVVLGLGSGA
jgi:hypothetical protein